MYAPSEIILFLWCQVVFTEARFDFQTVLAKELPWGIEVFSLGGKLVGWGLGGMWGEDIYGVPLA